jgi:hypothetical protein
MFMAIRHRSTGFQGGSTWIQHSWGLPCFHEKFAELLINDLPKARKRVGRRLWASKVLQHDVVQKDLFQGIELVLYLLVDFEVIG